MQPQSAIYTLKLGTRPKGGSPEDNCGLWILDWRMQILD
jgi:hypothetical protein